MNSAGLRPKGILLASAVAIFRAAAASAAGPIPTIDLSGESHRQVIVDREPGQYLGHTTTALMEDGKTILIVRFR